MSETVANHAAKSARNALQRVEETLKRVDTLEQIIPKLVDATNNAVGQLQSQLSQAVETLDAIIGILGPDAVSTAVLEARQTRAVNNSEQQKAKLAEEVAAGRVKVVDVVTEKSLLVFKETGKDGAEVVPSRVQFAATQLKPEFREQLLGKGAGASITDAENGHTFEITEILEPVEGSPEPAHAPVSAETVETK
jgi:hypothetical protein